jgi:antitoxin component of RelBE/YafQ-DinJ toxin-antitoxin module
MLKTEQLHFKIDKSTKERLQIVAGEKGLNLSSFIRMTLTKAANI